MPLLSESLPTLLTSSLRYFFLAMLSIVVEPSSHREAWLRRLSLFSIFLPYLGALILAIYISLYKFGNRDLTRVPRNSIGITRAHHY